MSVVAGCLPFRPKDFDVESCKAGLDAFRVDFSPAVPSFWALIPSVLVKDATNLLFFCFDRSIITSGGMGSPLFLAAVATAMAAASAAFFSLVDSI